MITSFLTVVSVSLFEKYIRLSGYILKQTGCLCFDKQRLDLCVSTDVGHCIRIVTQIGLWAFGRIVRSVVRPTLVHTIEFETWNTIGSGFRLGVCPNAAVRFTDYELSGFDNRDFCGGYDGLSVYNSGTVSIESHSVSHVDLLDHFLNVTHKFDGLVHLMSLLLFTQTSCKQ
jgi:hypothetical protein